MPEITFSRYVLSSWLLPCFVLWMDKNIYLLSLRVFHEGLFFCDAFPISESCEWEQCGCTKNSSLEHIQPQSDNIPGNGSPQHMPELPKCLTLPHKSEAQGAFLGTHFKEAKFRWHCSLIFTPAAKIILLLFALFSTYEKTGGVRRLTANKPNFPVTGRQKLQSRQGKWWASNSSILPSGKTDSVGACEAQVKLLAQLGP